MAGCKLEFEFLHQLPKLEVSGFLFIPNIATGSITLPPLDLDPLTFLAAGSIGQAERFDRRSERDQGEMRDQDEADPLRQFPWRASKHS